MCLRKLDAAKRSILDTQKTTESDFCLTNKGPLSNLSKIAIDEARVFARESRINRDYNARLIRLKQIDFYEVRINFRIDFYEPAPEREK
jgi:hypothetical protein